MTIKKFQGKTKEEAIALAKEEMGASVVIMNVKEVRQKGFLGIQGQHVRGDSRTGRCCHATAFL